MRRSRRSRRKSRTRLNWSPILWLATIGSCIVGFMYSPVTAPTHIRVVGALPDDQARIKAIIKTLQGKPAMTAPYGTVIEALMRRPDVRGAKLTLNPFGRGLATVTMEQPAALVMGRAGLALGYDGSLFPVKGKFEFLPQVELPAGVLSSSSAFVTEWDGRKAAQVCQLAASLSRPDVSVVAAPDGSVCLNLGSDARVELGLPEKLSEKFRRLGQIQESNPDMLKGGAVINLAAPDHPMLRNRAGNND